MRHFSRMLLVLAILGVSYWAPAAEIKLLSQPFDPYIHPRPGRGQENVPLLTSFYIELGTQKGDSHDAVLPESVTLELEPTGLPAFKILRADRQVAEGFRVRFLPGSNSEAGNVVAVYIDSERKLLPATTYTVRIGARSRDGAVLSGNAAEWQFTTEQAPQTNVVKFDHSLKSPMVRWQGGFFTGFCSPSFCTSAANRLPTYRLMDQVRQTSPRAWSVQRDFWLTGMEYQPSFLSGNLPNIVRERETRRIAAIDKQPEGVKLCVEDFFGHEQYGIPADRPLSEDYHPGDEVLIADGIHDARAKVLATDDAKRTVTVTAFTDPAEGWKIAYAAPPNRKEAPNAPGLFPPGGCYLRKFKPCGTPVYCWKRLDYEWDVSHKQFRRRLMPNFADASGDLSLDGRSWTTAKDYAELHEAVRAITSHVIERYGDATLEFPWSVFNEPDLSPVFWRSDWNELQKFYDYAADGILRAFEDHGYDSDRVMVGGLELGAIFGVNMRLEEFLGHCSPRAKVAGALLENAAFADRRLDGKRSKRVENLCKAHNGRGSPCDFISIHAYNYSKIMAQKLIRAKELALEIDPEYFAKLWINSHESCPGWNPPPDPAFSDSYLGNGYFPTWCADVMRRQLQKAVADPRYACGESILTFWPWPCQNFQGINDCVRAIQVDDNGDGAADRTATVAMPILHFLGLTAQMGPEYRVLSEQVSGGHVVSGIVSQVENRLYVLLYSHNGMDTESRSEKEFEVVLRLTDFPPRPIRVTEYRFDKDHNSYFRLGRQLRDKRLEGSKDASQSALLQEIIRQMESGSRDEQLTALNRMAELGPLAVQGFGAIAALIQATKDAVIVGRAVEVIQRIEKSTVYPAAEIQKIEELAALRPTNETSPSVNAEGQLTFRCKLSGNGANWIRIEPQAEAAYNDKRNSTKSSISLSERLSSSLPMAPCLPWTKSSLSVR